MATAEEQQVSACADYNDRIRSVYVVRKFKVRDDRALMLSEPECERLLFAAISGIAIHPNRHAVTIPL